MLKRYSAVMLLAGLVALGTLAAGCQDKPNDVAASGIQGSDSVEIVDARFVSTGDSAGQNYGGGSTYYWIVKLKFKNTFSSADATLNPNVGKFVFTAIDGSRYQGVDSGSAALIGLSNDVSPMKHDEVRTFTVGFRVMQQEQGQIAYEPY